MFDWDGSAWVQVGLDIDGEASFDRSGYSVSLDGNRVAIGAVLNNGTGSDSGHVRVFDWDGSAWVQVGLDIDGEASIDQSGYSVSLDGNRVAIGAPFNDGNGTSSGHVRVFDWDGSAWVQVGLDIDGEASIDQSGYSVSLDGNRVAIGAPFNDGNGSNSGHVRVFDWDGSAWVQVGLDIDGEASNDQSGYSVSLDGNRVAIGAPFNDGNGTDSGHVRVFDWDGSVWVQIGLDIDGEASSDRSGHSVSLDGNRVAIGAPFNDGNGSNSGHVRVFDILTQSWVQNGSDLNGSLPDKSGTSVAINDAGDIVAIGAPTHDNIGTTRIYQLISGIWTQLGNDIDSEAIADEGGTSVSLNSEGNRVAIGAPSNDTDRGNVRIYEWDGTTWNQIGSDIDGAANNDKSGTSVSLNSVGNRVAVGSPFYDGSGTDVGHVRVFEYCATDWVQIGSDIDGETDNDHFGTSVSLDGDRLAIGAPLNDGLGTDRGHVRVYEWDGTTWNQLGSDIDGEDDGDQSGTSVSLSGNHLVIGAPFNDGANGTDSGHVRVYDWDGSSWSQIGDDIDGVAAGDNSGTSVSINNNGNVVAIGSPLNSDNGGKVQIYQLISNVWTQISIDLNGETSVDRNGSSVALNRMGDIVVIGSPLHDFCCGQSRIFQFSTQIGDDIIGGIGDRSGHSVSLNGSGDVLAIGAPGNDVGGTDAGRVRVYEFSGGSWTQKGGDIVGTLSLLISGFSVSINEAGTIVAVGAPGNPSGSDAGSVTIYEFNGSDWVQKGSVLLGLAESDQFGYSVSLNASGTRVAVGAPTHDGSSIKVGQVVVYEFSSDWTIIGGVVDGTNSFDEFGTSVSLNSVGNRLAVGAPYNADGGYNTGQVRIFEFSNPWTQIGDNINGEADNDLTGTSVSLNAAGDFVSIGSVQDTGSDNGTVRNYIYESSIWNRFGFDFSGSSVNDAGGTSTAVSNDGDVVALGAPLNDFGGTDAGEALVFRTMESTAGSGAGDPKITTITGETYHLPIDELCYCLLDTQDPDDRLIINGKCHIRKNGKSYFRYLYIYYNNMELAIRLPNLKLLDVSDITEKTSKKHTVKYAEFNSYQNKHIVEKQNTVRVREYDILTEKYGKVIVTASKNKYKVKLFGYKHKLCGSDIIGAFIGTDRLKTVPVLNYHLPISSK